MRDVVPRHKGRLHGRHGPVIGRLLLVPVDGAAVANGNVDFVAEHHLEQGRVGVEKSVVAGCGADKDARAGPGGACRRKQRDARLKDAPRCAGRLRPEVIVCVYDEHAQGAAPAGHVLDGVPSLELGVIPQGHGL